MKVWNLKTGKEWLSLKGHLGAATGVSWSSSGDRIACASSDGTVRIWNDAMADETAERAHRSFDPSKFLSNVGTVFKAEFTDQGAVNITDAATGRTVSTLRGHTSPVNAAAFNAGGSRVATAGRDGTVKLWESATGRETCSFDAGTKELSSLAFSTDGWQLAAVGRDGPVKVWDAPGGWNYGRIQRGSRRAER